MKKSHILFLLGICILFAGCASIVSKNRWPFSVMTEPRGADITITNKRGNEVFKGKTPMVMHLRSGAGFFQKESYQVTLSMEGYETMVIPVKCSLNGWYAGNILLGGVIGMLIVDPITGAMYKLKSEGLTETLTPLKASSQIPSLKIIDIKTLSPEQRKNIEVITP